MSKKPKHQGEKAARGRRPGDPDARRAYRFVMRMHPDLADALNRLADEAGLSRSLFVERVLISFANNNPEIRLDHIGRKIEPGLPRARDTLGSFASFGRAWRRWEAMRHDVIGEDAAHPDPYRGTYVDDHGRDEQGRGTDTQRRPPVLDRLRPEDEKEKKIRPHRGSGRGGSDKK